MTEDSQDAVDGSAEGADERSVEEPRRPRPAPSPTSRARRAAAAGVEPALRRPRPTPEPSATVALTKTRTDEPGPAVGDDSATGDSTTDDVAVASETKEPTPHRITNRSPLWLAALLVLLLVALGGGAWWLHTSPAKSGSASQRDQALSAAKTSVPLILSYSYKSFDADLAKSKVQLTGKAQSDYVTAMTTTIKPAAAKAHVIVQASTDTNGAGVETVSADGDQVTVIVFGEQKVTNATLTTPRIDMFRVRAVLERIGGHWLISKFNQI
jgi:Mce-associated membrane protein